MRGCGGGGGGGDLDGTERSMLLCCELNSIISGSMHFFLHFSTVSESYAFQFLHLSFISLSLHSCSFLASKQFNRVQILRTQSLQPKGGFDLKNFDQPVFVNTSLFEGFHDKMLYRLRHFLKAELKDKDR